MTDQPQKKVYKPRASKGKPATSCGGRDEEDDPGCSLPPSKPRNTTCATPSTTSATRTDQHAPQYVVNPQIAKFVAHSKRGKYDVYIGRPNPLIDLPREECIWGNPFKLVEEKDRAAITQTYRDWITQPEQAHLVQKAKQELKGLVLGCWCSPKMCHGHILAALANDFPLDQVYLKVEQK